MDIQKIGLFIATLRKEKNMTQKNLADKIDLTDKAVSRWETGKGLPDSSSWQALSSALGVSVNELLNGERIEAKSFVTAADKTLINAVEYTRMSTTKKFFLIGIAGMLALIMLIASLVLSNNNSFFKSHYSVQINQKMISIPVPEYSFHRRTGGEWHATFKTLKSTDEVSLYIDRYLSRLEIIEVDDSVAYYDNHQDITIINYHCNNDGIAMINSIYINYIDGRARIY